MKQLDESINMKSIFDALQKMSYDDAVKFAKTEMSEQPPKTNEVIWLFSAKHGTLVPSNQGSINGQL